MLSPRHNLASPSPRSPPPPQTPGPVAAGGGGGGGAGRPLEQLHTLAERFSRIALSPTPVQHQQMLSPTPGIHQQHQHQHQQQQQQQQQVTPVVTAVNNNIALSPGNIANGRQLMARGIAPTNINEMMMNDNNSNNNNNNNNNNVDNAATVHQQQRLQMFRTPAATNNGGQGRFTQRGYPATAIIPRTTTTATATATATPGVPVVAEADKVMNGSPHQNEVGIKAGAIIEGGGSPERPVSPSSKAKMSKEEIKRKMAKMAEMKGARQLQNGLLGIGQISPISKYNTHHHHQQQHQQQQQQQQQRQYQAQYNVGRQLSKAGTEGVNANNMAGLVGVNGESLFNDARAQDLLEPINTRLNDVEYDKEIYYHHIAARRRHNNDKESKENIAAEAETRRNPPRLLDARILDQEFSEKVRNQPAPRIAQFGVVDFVGNLKHKDRIIQRELLENQQLQKHADINNNNNGNGDTNEDEDEDGEDSEGERARQQMVSELSKLGLGDGFDPPSFDERSNTPYTVTTADHSEYSDNNELDYDDNEDEDEDGDYQQRVGDKIMGSMDRRSSIGNIGKFNTIGNTNNIEEEDEGEDEHDAAKFDHMVGNLRPGRLMSEYSDEDNDSDNKNNSNKNNNKNNNKEMENNSGEWKRVQSIQHSKQQFRRNHPSNKRKQKRREIEQRRMSLCSLRVPLRSNRPLTSSMAERLAQDEATRNEQQLHRLHQLEQQQQQQQQQQRARNTTRRNANLTTNDSPGVVRAVMAENRQLRNEVERLRKDLDLLAQLVLVQKESNQRMHMALERRVDMLQGIDDHTHIDDHHYDHQYHPHHHHHQ
ncbi:hypothetical protein GQ42DRAFT_9733 [Ramicandelaber brevisporus]|nr:hypothetical protein GQ42DRAFT_9733 [Ramicandelaber brevisporus]